MTFDPQNPPNTGSCLDCLETHRHCQCGPAVTLCETRGCDGAIVSTFIDLGPHGLETTRLEECAAHVIFSQVAEADDEIDSPWVTVYQSAVAR